jgi:hypothetical protein
MPAFGVWLNCQRAASGARDPRAGGRRAQMSTGRTTVDKYILAEIPPRVKRLLVHLAENCTTRPNFPSHAPGARPRPWPSPPAIAISREGRRARPGLARVVLQAQVGIGHTHVAVGPATRANPVASCPQGASCPVRGWHIGNEHGSMRDKFADDTSSDQERTQ